MAFWADGIELHAAAVLCDLAAASALAALAGGFDEAAPSAIGTGIAAGDVQPDDAAFDGLPERYADLILEVLAGLRAFVLYRSAFTAKDAGEDVAEAARAAGARGPLAGAVGHVGKVEASEVEASSAASRLASEKTA